MQSTLNRQQADAPTGGGIARLDDETLLLRYQQTGERLLFEQLMRRYEREIYAYLRRYIGQPEMAEDAYQRTFLQVHLKCDQFETGRRFRPWLYAIATNQAIDVQRRNRRHRMASLDASVVREESGSWSETLVCDTPSPVAETVRMEQAERVRGEVDQLSPSLRQVVELVYYQGLKYREAADALGIPVGTVKSRLHAAIGRLQQAYETAAE